MATIGLFSMAVASPTKSLPSLPRALLRHLQSSSSAPSRTTSTFPVLSSSKSKTPMSSPATSSSKPTPKAQPHRKHSSSTIVYAIVLEISCRINTLSPYYLKRVVVSCFIKRAKSFTILQSCLDSTTTFLSKTGPISMYLACGLLDSARKVFNLVPVSTCDVVSWNSVVSGYLERHENWGALQVFDKMLVDGSTRPDNVTLVNVLTAFKRMGCVDLGRKIHGFVLRSGFALNVYLGSSLVDMYVKCRCLDDARKVFDRMPQRNVVSWTSMIVGYAQSGSLKARLSCLESSVSKIKSEIF